MNQFTQIGINNDVDPGYPIDSIGFDEDRVQDLANKLVIEIFRALLLPLSGWQRKVFGRLFWMPAYRFSQIAVRFEAITARAGFRSAAQWMLKQFARGSEARYLGEIPAEGPLLIASNHPGSLDALAITANLPRDDLSIVVSGIPFLHSLDGLRDHFIYSAYDPHGRMLVIRSTIRHLRAGKAVLIFPTGLVDPDPSFLSGAQEALTRWSPSLEIILRKAPETHLLPVIASGVVAPECMHHPLIRLFKMNAWQRQRLAEYLQVIQQLVFRRDFKLFPYITFGAPLSLADLESSGEQGSLMHTIISAAQGVLAQYTLQGVVEGGLP